MAIIWSCPVAPSTYAAAGREISVPAAICPGCRRGLTGWGGYWRWMRGEQVPEQRIWIRRGRCKRCRHTHALLPSFLFVSRLDVAQVIGTALDQAANGTGARTIAQELAVPHTTVRDWWRRVRSKAPTLLASLLVLAISLDPAPVDLTTDGSPAMLEALRCAWQRTQRRLAQRAPDQWAFWSLVSGGLAVAANTSPPLPG